MLFVWNSTKNKKNRKLSVTPEKKLARRPSVALRPLASCLLRPKGDSYYKFWQIRSRLCRHGRVVTVVTSRHAQRRKTMGGYQKKKRRVLSYSLRSHYALSGVLLVIINKMPAGRGATEGSKRVLVLFFFFERDTSVTGA